MRRIGAYEAKTHLPRLLKAVEAGETFTITNRGIEVAILAPVDARRGMAVNETASALRAFRRTHNLGGLSIRELIDEGRA